MDRIFCFDYFFIEIFAIIVNEKPLDVTFIGLLNVVIFFNSFWNCFIASFIWQTVIKIYSTICGSHQMYDSFITIIS